MFIQLVSTHLLKPSSAAKLLKVWLEPAYQIALVPVYW